MDLENQKRVKEFAEQYGCENVVVMLGAAEGEAAGLAAETVTAGDPTYYGDIFSFLQRGGGRIARNDGRGVLGIIQEYKAS